MKLIQFPARKTVPKQARQRKARKPYSQEVRILIQADQIIQRCMRGFLDKNRTADYLRANELHKKMVSLVQELIRKG